MSIWNDTPLAADLLAEMRRLTDEFEHRISAQTPLPALASLQAIAARSEDLAGWVQHLVENTHAEPGDAEPEPNGLYL